MSKSVSNPLARRAALALSAFIAATGAHVERPITVDGKTHDPGWREVQQQEPQTGDETRSVWREPYVDAETLAALSEALNRLPPELVEVVDLAFFQDLTQDEVAERLGITQTGVCRRMKRALAVLREALDA